MEPVVIAMIYDDSFVMPTRVALQSIYESRNPHQKYIIYLFTTSKNIDGRAVFEDINTSNFSVCIKRLETNNADLVYSNDKISATPTALIKFQLPYLLSEYDRVLYLDGDIMVRKDLASLYFSNLGDNYAIAVKDMPLMTQSNPQMNRLLRANENYFNTGVMLLNLKKMREDNCTERLREYKKLGINFFMDQDAFNVIFEGKVIFENAYYNLVFRAAENYGLEFFCSFYDMDIPCSFEQLYDNATIIHMASSYKPWKYETPVLSAWFQSYYNRTPFSKDKIYLEKRVPPQRLQRFIDGHEKGNGSLAVCSNVVEIMQIVRFRSFWTENEETDILLDIHLKKYVDIIKETTLFRNVYLCDMEKYCDEEKERDNVKDNGNNSKIKGFIVEQNLEQKIFTYSFYLLCRLDGIGEKIVNGAIKDRKYPEVLFVEGCYRGLEAAFNKDREIYKYVTRWYLNKDTTVNIKTERKNVIFLPEICKMPLLCKDQGDLFTRKIIFYVLEENVGITLYNCLVSCLSVLPKEFCMVVAEDRRISDYCQTNNIPFDATLDWLAIYGDTEKRLIVSDNVNEFYGTILKTNKNIGFIGLEKLNVQSRMNGAISSEQLRIPESMDELCQYVNYFFAQNDV